MPSQLLSLHNGYFTVINPAFVGSATNGNVNRMITWSEARGDPYVDLHESYITRG